MAAPKNITSRYLIDARNNLRDQVARLGLHPFAAENELNRLLSIETGLNPSELAPAIAKAETETKGTKIGKAREFNAAQIEDAREIEAARIDPIERVEAPTLGGVERVRANLLDTTGDRQFRAGQYGLLQALQARANGQTPSLAALEARDAFDRIGANQQGAIAASRVSPAVALRLAINQAGELNQSAAREAVKAQMAERIAAEQQLAEVSATGRTQDQQLAAQQAGILNTTSATNAAAANQRAVEQAEMILRAKLADQVAANTRATNQASLQQQSLTSNQAAVNARATQQAALEQEARRVNAAAVNERNIQQGNIAGGIQQANIAGAAQRAAAGSAAGATVTAAQINADASIFNNSVNNLNSSGQGNGQLGSEGQNTNSNNQNNQNNNNANIGGSLINAGGGALASDKKLKKDVKAGDHDADAFLEALNARTFRYKDQKHGAGKRLGIMAQDAEKSEMGAEAVVDTPDGKMIDFKKGLSAVLAAQARLHDRMAKLEGRKAA